MWDDPVDRDLAAVRPWWQRLAADAPAALGGLWFGMAGLVTPRGPVLHLYVAGCRTFDVADASGDWATDVSWEPPDRYVVAPALAGLATGPYERVLEHAGAVVSLLRPQDVVVVEGVAVGFDDGDFLVTWSRPPA